VAVSGVVVLGIKYEYFWCWKQWLFPEIPDSRVHAHGRAERCDSCWMQQLLCTL